MVLVCLPVAGPYEGNEADAGVRLLQHWSNCGEGHEHERCNHASQHPAVSHSSGAVSWGHTTSDKVPTAYANFRFSRGAGNYQRPSVVRFYRRALGFDNYGFGKDVDLVNVVARFTSSVLGTSGVVRSQHVFTLYVLATNAPPY